MKRIIYYLPTKKAYIIHKGDFHKITKEMFAWILQHYTLTKDHHSENTIWFNINEHKHLQTATNN